MNTNIVLGKADIIVLTVVLIIMILAVRIVIGFFKKDK